MKKILFVIDSLRIGGAEKSLVTLLNSLDYEQYQVDLLLFARGGEFEQLLPKEVNVLNVPELFQYMSIAWFCFWEKMMHPLYLIAQLSYSIKLRIRKSDSVEQAILLWKSYSKRLLALSYKYDCAIAYGQGLPTFFVADKVNALKKIAWINATYIPPEKCLPFVQEKYGRFDLVNGVSDTIKELIVHKLEIPEDKVVVIRDILDCNFVKKMAQLEDSVSKEMDFNGTKILTVGRLTEVKGHDLAIDAASKLVRNGIDFRWYFIGEGEFRGFLQKKIADEDLNGKVILLGKRSNPYPYFDKCDIYVQPSRYEGFGITIAEAKMFRKPIVVTKFNSVEEQIVNNENGLIVDLNGEDIAKGIEQILQDNTLKTSLIESLEQFDFSISDELEKFYSILE